MAPLPADGSQIPRRGRRRAGFVGYLDSVRDAQRARNSPRLSVPAESQELDREAMLRKQREASRAAIERRRAAGAVRSNTSYHDSKDASDGNAPRFGSAPEPSAGGKSSVAPPADLDRVFMYFENVFQNARVSLFLICL